MEKFIAIFGGVLTGSTFVFYMYLFKRIIATTESKKVMSKVFILLGTKLVLLFSICYLFINVFNLESKPFVLALGGTYLVWLFGMFLTEFKKMKQIEGE